MGRQRRALIGVLVVVLLAATSAGCTRRGWPWSRTTTTRPRVTTTVPGVTTTTIPGVTTTTQAGPGVEGRYVRRVFDEIEQVATGETFQAGAVRTNGERVDLKFDAWAPAGDSVGKRPAIIWGFGGAFIVGSRQQMNSYAQDSARRGYVGITIDYRLEESASPITNLLRGIYNAYDDTIAAAEYLKANADRYGIDPEAIIVGGYSAGAINAVNAIVLPGGNAPVLGNIRVPRQVTKSPFVAGISFAGASAGSILGQSSSRPGQGPIIMFGGSTDNIVSYPNWQVRTCNDHKAAGNVCEMVTYEGAGHLLPNTAEMLDRSADFVVREALAAKGYGG